MSYWLVDVHAFTSEGPYRTKSAAFKARTVAQEENAYQPLIVLRIGVEMLIALLDLRDATRLYDHLADEDETC